MEKVGTPTERYIKENENTLRLKRIISEYRQPRSYFTDSIILIVENRLRALKRLFYNYPKILIKYHKEFFSLYNKKNSKKDRGCIVIANGPSQGYLTSEVLQKFKDAGNEIICINFWSDNADLSIIPPNILLISDPFTLNFDSAIDKFILEKNKRLKDYLTKYKGIKIFAPTNRKKDLEKIFSKERLSYFCDISARGLISNISPAFPYGYVFMTFYKALAHAVWFGYKNIYVLGIDNTYPRNIYVGPNNELLNLEVHAGSEDYVNHFKDCYKMGVADKLVEISFLFRDLFLFKRIRPDIINLDPYSLSDAFVKSSSLLEKGEIS